MSNTTYEDYQDIIALFNGKEWRVWLKFLKERKCKLRDKVMSYLRTKQFDEAFKLITIIDDIDLQIQLFTIYMKEIEQEFDK